MSHHSDNKVISALAFALNILFVALPLDILRYLRLRRKSVAGQVIVITGAGSGLGQRMAEIFALELQAKVAVLDINEAAANTVSDGIRAKGGTAIAWHCDVADAASMNRTAAQVRQWLGDVNIVICNAGILHFAHTLQLTTEQIQQALNVNVMGPINTIRAFLDQMETSNSGQIVGISSIAGYFGETYGMAYCPTKFAIRGVMDCLRMEMRDRNLDGIVCTTVCPYFVRTPMILNKGLRPTCRLISFMSVERCTRNIIDAILKEKCVAFVPGWISFIPMVSAWFSVNMLKMGRNYLNCRYEPAGNTSTQVSESCAQCGQKILSSDMDEFDIVQPILENGKSINGMNNINNKTSNNSKETNDKGEKDNICCCSGITQSITCDAGDNVANRKNPSHKISQSGYNSPRASTYDRYKLYDMENYFKVPKIHWFFIIPPALALTFAVWYSPESFDIDHWLLRPICGVLHRLGTDYSTIMLAINIGALLAHFCEAEKALLVANELNLTQVCAMKWFIQTFIMGFPSLVLLLAYKKRILASKSK